MYEKPPGEGYVLWHEKIEMIQLESEEIRSGKDLLQGASTGIKGGYQGLVPLVEFFPEIQENQLDTLGSCVRMRYMGNDDALPGLVPYLKEIGVPVEKMQSDI